jgi:hypothetical protein
MEGILVFLKMLKKRNENSGRWSEVPLFACC